MDIMEAGTVKFYDIKKGYGFIVNDKTQEEVFVHSTGLIDEIKEKDKVTYELKQGKKGMNAVNVKRV